MTPRGGVILTAPFPRSREGRRFCAFDTETELMDDHTPVPRLVCLQIYDPDDDAPRLYGYRDACQAFLNLARKALTEDVTIIGHNVAFDIAVLVRQFPDLWPLVWRLYDLGLIEDTIACEKLDSIARGEMDETSVHQRWVTVDGKRQKLGYSLAACAKYRLGLALDKGEDTWRLRYGELREVPVDAWPEDAARYALDDAYVTHALRYAQETAEARHPALAGEYVLGDVPAQTRAAWALFLCRWVGVRTDRLHVPRVRAELEARARKHEADLLASGILVPAQGSKPQKRLMPVIHSRVEAAFAQLGMPVPLTPTGKTSAAAETLLIAAVEDPLLGALNEYTSASKLLQFVASLELGFAYPIHTEPNFIVATGRASWGSTSPDGTVDDAKKINLQNLPKAKGLRESYIPPPGMLMFAVDYKQLELCALGYVCQQLVGYSRMLELINEGIDLHDTLAAQFIGVSYEDFQRRKATEPELDTVRQLAKAANFGFPGGMGVNKFILTARKQDGDKKLIHLLVPETIKRLKAAWFATFPELREYFKLTSAMADAGQLVQLTSGRVRGGIDFCSASNSLFQGIAADGAKEALYLVQRTMFSDPDSPAYGGHVFAMIHDELVGCVLESNAADSVEHVYQLMMVAMRIRLPGVHIEGSKCLMRRWIKKAEATFNSAGDLIPFEDGPKYHELVAKGKIYG